MTTTPKPKAAAPKRAAAAARKRPASTRTPKRAAAAAAEKQPTTRTVAYRGLTLAVPPVEEWSSELYYLVAELQGGTGDDRLAIDITREILGEDQFALVRQKHRDDGVKYVDMQNVTVELFNAIFAEFGTSVGE